MDDPEIATTLTIARLYRIVLGRAADPHGFHHYRIGLAEPGGLEQIVDSLLNSAEFAQRAGNAGADWLVSNARGRRAESSDKAQPFAALVLGLLRDPDVERRLSTLQALGFETVPLGDRPLYRLWRAELSASRAAVRAVAPPQGSGHVLSVLIECRDAPAGAFARSVTSLKEQTAAGVELIVTTDGTQDEAAAAVGRSSGLAVRVVGPRPWRRSDRHRLGRALRLASGCFVCLLPEGDRLAADAVAELAALPPGTDLVLSDEDVVGPDGLCGHPALNGGWDPDLALAFPPRCLVVVRSGLLRAIGGFRAAAAPAHDWDVLLRGVEKVGAARIAHLPTVLRHRVAPHAAGQPPGPGIVRRHLDATKQEVERLEGDGVSTPIRVVHPLPASPPRATIIIPTRDRAGLLHRCLDGLLTRTDYPDFEVMIVDNDSREPATGRLIHHAQADPRVRVLAVPGEFNWSLLNNRAVTAMSGTVAILLNNDTDVIGRNWLRELVSQAMRPKVGLVGAKLLYPDRTIQHAGIGLGADHGSVHLWRHADGVAPGYLDQLGVVRTVAAVTGACIGIRRSIFEEVGGLEEDELRVTWGDTDLCMRVRAAGYRIVWTPHALLYHLELATRGPDDAPEARLRFQREAEAFRRRWKGTADRDPYQSPHLDTLGEAPRLVVVGSPEELKRDPPDTA